MKKCAPNRRAMKQIPGNNRNTDILNLVDSRVCVMQHIIVTVVAADAVVENNTNIYFTYTYCMYIAILYSSSRHE